MNTSSRTQQEFSSELQHFQKGTFKPFKRGNPCPVCANDKGDCRYSPEDVDFIQCHTYVDACKGETVNGYVCVKEASGHTASFKKLGDRSLADSQKLVERRTQRQKQQKERKEALLKGLSIEQRDKATRLLNKILGLSTNHRENLKKRGLTDEEIDDGCFTSVAPNQELPFGIPANYPGARSGKLSVAGKGFTCPTWTPDGKISGWQMRLDDTEEGKYRWAKGAFSSHLLNGELPLTTIIPKKIEHNWLADIEGILKPCIAAKLLNAVCVGSSGGNIIGSPEQLSQIIKQFEVTEIRDFPDAGDVLNKNVMYARIKKYEYYKNLGIQVLVAWWGQETKGQCDVDELTTTQNIEYISTDEFLAIAQTLGTIPQHSQQPDTTINDKYYSQKAKQLEEEQEQFEQHCIRHNEELAAGAKIQWMLNYPERVKRTHEALRSIDAFKPVVQDTQFINLLVNQFLKQEQGQKTTSRLTDLEPGFYGLKVNMGGGKSVQMREVVSNFRSGNLLTFRNSIALQFCHHPAIANKIQYTWDIKSIQSTEEQREAWLRAKEMWMGGCIESLADFKPKDVLVLEEVEQVKRSILVGSTCRRDRRARLKLFTEHLQAAKYVFLCDADLSGSTLKWLQALDSSKKINVIHNITKRFEWQCYFYTGVSQISTDGEVKLSPNNRAEFEHALLNVVAHKRIPLIATDSQRWAEVIERTIFMVNPDAKGIRIDSTTKASNDKKLRGTVDAFLSDPNKWIEQNQPDYVIYSPTCEASLDITIADYFDTVFGYFVHANFLSCKQLLGRLRTNAPRHIFAKTHVGSDDVGSNSPLPQVLAKHMFEHNFQILREIVLTEYPEVKDDFQLLQKLNEIIDPESGEYKNPHIQAIVEIKAQDNYSRAELRKLLAEELERSGHVVTMLEPGDELMPCPSSPHRKEVIREWAEAIANAEVITIEQAREIQSSASSNMSERHAATKAILQYRLPEYTLTSQFLEDYYLDDRNWVTRQEMRYLLDHPEMSIRFDQEAWTQALKNDTAWWDVRSNALKIKALSTLGILAIARSGREWTKDTDWVLKFKELVLQNRGLVKLALSITAKPDSDPCYLLRRCLEQAGYPVIGVQRRMNGTRVRTYKVDAKVLADDWSVFSDVYTAISKRFEDKLSKLNKNGAMPQNNPVKIITSSACDFPDPLTQPGLEEILNEPDPPPNYSSFPSELKLGDWVIINLPKSPHNGRLAYISSIHRSCGQDWVSASFDDGTGQIVDLPIHQVGEAFIKQDAA